MSSAGHPGNVRASRDTKKEPRSQLKIKASNASRGAGSASVESATVFNNNQAPFKADEADNVGGSDPDCGLQHQLFTTSVHYCDESGQKSLASDASRSRGARIGEATPPRQRGGATSSQFKVEQGPGRAVQLHQNDDVDSQS